MKRTWSIVIGLFGLAALVSAQDRSAPTLSVSSSHRRGAETYGTTATSYYHVGAQEFLPENSYLSVYDDTGGANAYQRYPVQGDSNFVATAHLPSGARLTYMEVDYCNTDATGDLFAYASGCDYLGANCISLSYMDGPASSGCTFMTADLTPANWTVNNLDNEIILRLNPTVLGGTISFAGVILGYVLQVSAAPPVPSFTDVPTTDFGFQYIEALATSGITGGCGGGHYCPDSPVTRRQMAIFLAKALGLQWP